MLWLGKLFIVGVTVEANAMVGIDVDSGTNGRTKNIVPLTFPFSAHCITYY